MEYFSSKNVFPLTADIGPNGHLMLGGCDLADLAKEFGTPLYILDEHDLRDRCRAFISEFQSRYPDTRVAYASKAFTNIAVIKLLLEEGMSIEVVSGGELAAARAGGATPSTISFHGNNKSLNEIKEAVKCGVGRIVVDNFHELELLNHVTQETGHTQDVMVRISPSVDPHTHSYISTGTLDSKFGFSIETGQAEKAIKDILSYSHLRLLGLHCHLGSQIFETQPYENAIRITLEFAAQMRKLGFNLLELSTGGGFAIAYTRSEQPPPISTYASAITSALQRECRKLGFDNPTLVIEPGRAIIGPAGISLYTVGSRKAIPNVRTYVSVDGGMGDNIRPALYQASYEAVVANRMLEPPLEHVTIAGKFCESGDILIQDVDIPATRPGDLIAIPASGAYCVPMASNYNMATRPAIIMIRDGTARLIRRRETYEDLLATDIV
jgi:diaminopimelate decarboxylase